MTVWFLERGADLFGVTLVPAVGSLLICCGLFGGRNRGRPRGPRCWPDSFITLELPH